MRVWFKAAAISFGKAVGTAIAITLIVFAVLKAAVPSTRFIPWLGNVLTGNVGHSSTHSALVDRVFVLRLPYTLDLIVVSFAIAVVAGFAIASVSARSPASRFSRFILVAALALESVPVFWLALMLQLLALLLGNGQLPYGVASSDNFDWGDRLSHLILPAGTLALFQIQPLAEYFRKRPSSAVRPTSTTAWLAELFALFAKKLPAIAGATLIVEVIFAWPGEGRLFLVAAGGEDFPLSASLLMFAAMSILTLRFIADLLKAPDDRFRAVE
jgi:peptide/nickel transport system permease protein